MASLRILALAALCSIACPALAAACNYDAQNGLFSWSRCWCVTRWLILAAAAVFLWLIVSLWLFPSMLSLDRPRPPWPRTAFAWTVAWFWLGFCMLFVVVFGWVSDELRRQLKKDSSGIIPGFSALDDHVVWIAVILGGLLGMFILTRIFRHRECSVASGR